MPPDDDFLIIEDPDPTPTPLNDDEIEDALRACAETESVIESIKEVDIDVTDVSSGAPGYPSGDWADKPTSPWETMTETMEELRAASFLQRFQERTGRSPEALAEAADKRKKAFLNFFDLAGRLNEAGVAFGIKSANLNAETGEVTVVFNSRKSTSL